MIKIKTKARKIENDYVVNYLINTKNVIMVEYKAILLQVLKEYIEEYDLNVNNVLKDLGKDYYKSLEDAI